MTKTQIFEEVVRIVKNDASFCKDESGADVEMYRAKISDEMEDEEFLYLMQAYLATFGVQGHLSFRNASRGHLRFMVKRYRDALYVVATAEDSPLQVGDRIVGINGVSVSEFAAEHKEMLYGEPEERQGFAWLTLLSYAKKIRVVCKKDGSEVDCPVELGGVWSTSAQRYCCRKLRDGVAYMKLADFGDDTAIVNMYKENDALLRNSAYLVIDVRANGGGNDSAFFPLLEFCLPFGRKLSELTEGIYDSDAEFNYTERNCDARIEQFEKYLQEDVPEDTRNMLTQMLDGLKKNRGKGFMTDDSVDGEQLPYVGAALPEKVFIIADEECASSGDAFVDMMRKSEKVTVVGRPTMGILDYSNCTGCFWDDYYLVYPTSRALYIDRGIRMRGNGVPVDVHIPWTPEHLERDVDMDTVLELIEKDMQEKR